MSSCKNFGGKVVLITGSTSGVGEGIANYLAKLGAKLVITGRSESNVKRVSEKCYWLSPQKAKPLEVTADLTFDEDVKRLFASTITHFGQIDVLVNNASGVWFTSIFDPNFMDNFDQTMSINLRSAVYLTHLAVPYLEKTNGNIINISSIYGLMPDVRSMNYCMAKCALDMFTKCLALDLGPKRVRANSINVGYVKTNNPNAVLRDLEDASKQTPLEILGEPQDIAYVVAFIASSEARLITGITMAADSGNLVGRYDSK